MPERIMSTITVSTVTVLFLLLSVFGAGAVRVDAELLLCLSFDEKEGDVAKDCSLHQFHATVSGAERVSGKFGKALRFDGGADFVSVPDSPELRLLNGGTFMAWINLEGAGAKAWPRVLSKEQTTGGDGGYHLFLDQAGSYKVRVTVDGRGHTSPEAPETGIWCHVAATCDGENIKIYLNGEMILEGLQEKPFPDTNPELRIGNSPAGERPFEGIIDEVRIWGRALNKDEIQRQMDMTTEELEGLISVDPLSKIAATWGRVKITSDW